MNPVVYVFPRENVIQKLTGQRVYVKQKEKQI